MNLLLFLEYMNVVLACEGCVDSLPDQSRCVEKQLAEMQASARLYMKSPWRRIN